MLTTTNKGARSLFCVLLLIMFLLLASFHLSQSQTVQASSCGAVYLYQAQCTSVCNYYVSHNSTQCYGTKYDHYTAPPANRFVTEWTPTFPGNVSPTGCPTMCQ